MTGKKRDFAKIFCCLALLVVSIATSWPLIEANSRYIYHEDDGHHFNRTVEMAARRDLNPHYFNKPALHFYLRLPVVYAAAWYEKNAGRLQSLREIRTRDPYGLAGYAYTPSHPRILAAMRLESVIWNALIAIATFVIVGLLRHSVRVAFAAGLIAALSPEALKNSYIIGVDTLMALMCIVTSAYAIWALNSYSRKKLSIAALLAGLACAAKYNAAPIVLVPLILWFLNDRGFKGFFICALGPLLGFLIGAPYSVLSFSEFWSGVSYEAWHYSVAGHEGHMAERGWPQALLYLRWALSDGVGVSAAILAILGGSWLSVYNRRAFFLLLVFPLSYAALMISQRAHFTRNMVVMIPYLAAFAGVGIAALISVIKDRRWQHVAMLAITAFAIWPIANISLGSVSSAQKSHDSRDALVDWIATEDNRSQADIAVAGNLLIPVSTFALLGVDAFNPEKVSLAELIQTGYEYIALPTDMSLLDAELTELVTSFPGEPWPQRVPKSPAISIVKIKPQGVEKAARKAPSKLSFIAGKSLLWPNCPGISGEEYCWITARITELSIPALVGPGVFEVRSPWPNQSVTITDQHGQLLASTKLTNSDTWETLPIPASPSGQPRTVFLKISQLHSPHSQGLNSDRRRLGIAVRNGG
jgi:hypothetical protein